MADLHSRSRTSPDASDGRGALTKAARAGHAAKGLIYLIIGVLSLSAALSGGGGGTGSQGALAKLSQQSFGVALLWITGIGLMLYAVYRIASAFLDPEHEAGDGAKGAFARIGFFFSGAIYGGLGLSAIQMASGSGGGSGGSGGAQGWTAKLMSMPWGPWLVGLAGVIAAIVAIVHFKRAMGADFMDKMRTGQMSSTERTWVKRSGQWGLTARAAIFLIIGWFLVQAALTNNPGQARGLKGALDALSQQSYGPWLMGLVALGLIAYAGYCFASAKYRSFADRSSRASSSRARAGRA